MENNSTGIMIIGQARIKTYETLSRYPLYDYFCDTGKGKECNVLLIGNGWVGTEFFKAIFWCGVYPGVKLNITIASSNAARYQKKLEKALPGLKTFADFEGESSSKYHYADIRIREVSFETVRGAGIDDALAQGLDIKAQNYIVVAVGDSVASALIAEEIAKRTNPQNPHIILAFTEETSSENSPYTAVSYEPIDVQNWMVYQLAQNINFMYEMKSAGNAIDRETINQEFDTAYQKEFSESPQAADDEFDSIGSFCGGNYNADSSLAAAVHTQYKLHYCGNQKEEQYDCTKLIEQISNKTEQYSKLVQWEHDRWNAFMTIRGFRAPTEWEIENTLFRSGNKHCQKIKSPYLHMCLCDSKGRSANDGINWAEPQSELDQVSKTCRETWGALAKSKKGDIKRYKDEIWNICRAESRLPDQTFASLKNYLDSVDRLLDDYENAYRVYKVCYSELSGMIEKECPEIFVKIEEINKNIDLQIEFNKRTDFFSIDAELIDMMPNYVRMADGWTLITVLEDPAATDVLIPWLIFAKKAVFLFKKNDLRLESTKKHFEEFLKDNGNYVECEWNQVYFSQEQLSKTIDKKLKGLGERCFIAVSENASPQVTMALSRFWDSTPLLYFDQRKGICSFNRSFCQPSTGGKRISINQYFELKNADVDRPFASTISYSVCRKLEQPFWDANKIKIVSKGDGKNSVYNLWNDSKDKILRNAPDELRTKAGTLFELLVYYKVKNSGLFDDVATGKKFFWGQEQGVSNELDVIALRGYTPFFISCKTSPVIEKSYIYEVLSEAKMLHAIPVLAVSQDISKEASDGFKANRSVISRAAETGVALIDQHILKSEELTQQAFQQIINGTYKGPVNFK